MSPPRASPPSNKKRAGARPGVVVDAPHETVDFLPDDSPLPSAATTTVRPPPRTKVGRALGRVGKTLQLAAGVTIVTAASIAVAWGGRRYVMQSPRFAVRTILVDGNHRRAASTVASEAAIAVGVHA